MTDDELPRQLAVLRTYHDALAVLRARRDELDIPNDIIDEIAGLTIGHTSRLIAHRPAKFFGPVSWNVWAALGLRVVVLHDPHALKRARANRNWQLRRQGQKLAKHDYPGKLLGQTADFLRKIARKGGLARAARLNPSWRKGIARKAGKARWAAKSTREYVGVTRKP